ncbi:hypothetical protein Hypma_012869 [Hypsizygus marmoreus]|uniref:Uncharacterized protein n=1 Tax=Hypsizygus marmoreus TaxID=39966 RepID=A0A369JK60_HYPMA|nr:hypothetical protein Hypma_012869 [Hypsizygus marmoreus]
MGKWTPDYVDVVLHSKIKTLVSGAITRSSLEKTEPTISYETFVNDLDTGDSFTTSLIDILVKELAERRTRPPNDRRLIADRSAKSLRLLATPLRVYRDRSMGRYHPSRRSTNLSEYLSAPPIEMDMEEDEDIFERMLDNGTSIEGARINSDLYEAYGTHVVPSSSRAIASPSPPAEDARSPLSPHPPSRSGPWSMSNYIPIPTTTLSRQSSIRRPIRSRTVDFNEFTSRRRSSTRDNQSSRAEPTEAPDLRDGGWTRNSQATRRFFPFIRTRRHESADSYWGSEVPGPSVSHGTDAEDNNDPYMPEPPNAPWFNLTPPLDREPSTMEEVLADAALSDERAQSTAPRLRRGGLRAPESILSRHASPVSSTLVDEPPSGPQESVDHGLPEETGYPTPGSTGPEFLS